MQFCVLLENVGDYKQHSPLCHPQTVSAWCHMPVGP